MEDIEETFIHRDIPIKNRKRNMKADCSSITLITFSLVHTEEWIQSKFWNNIEGDKKTSRRHKRSQKRNKWIQSKFRIELKWQNLKWTSWQNEKATGITREY